MSIWERILDTKLKNFQDSFTTNINPDIIDAQTSALTNIIIDSATDFFGNTETSKKISKGWWNTDIKNARKTKKCTQQIQENKYTRKLYHSTRSKKTLSKSDRNVKTFLP